jgi:hypothetical protein
VCACIYFSWARLGVHKVIKFASEFYYFMHVRCLKPHTGFKHCLSFAIGGSLAIYPRANDLIGRLRASYKIQE